MTDVRNTTFTTAYDAAGRPTSLTSNLSDTTHPPILYTVNSYNPLGEITSANYGVTGSGTTATAHTATFDNRGRLLTIYDAVTGGSPYSLTLTYLNGQVASANDSVNGNWSSFAYDDFNRLKSSWCSANCPDGTNAEGYNYTYDEFGNRWTQTLATGSGPGFQPSYSFDINNRLTPTNCTSGAGNFCYDGAGNLEYDGLGGNWAHDAEGRVFVYQGSSATASYTYDAAGQRLHRVVNGTVYDYVFDNQGRENIKDNGGFSGWNWSNLYFGGSHVATYANSSTYFSHADHLGSERMETDPTGATNGSAETTLPFGEWTSTGMQNELGFTGDLLDNADGNVSHTPNRQYSQAQGRWMRPDPAGLAAVDPANPQTWNRYAYVANNPVSFVDPTGLQQDACSSPHNTCGPGQSPGNITDPSFAGQASSGYFIPVYEIYNTEWYDWGLYQVGTIFISAGDTVPDSSGFGTNCTPGTKGCFNVPQLCADVPNSPPGASATFNTTLVNQSTQGMWPATKLDYFYQTFRPGGTFDYKATGGDQYMDYGNWNFGYVCGANYPALFCQSAAGGNRMWRAATQGKNPFGNGFPLVKSPYGDQTRDNQQIRNGIQAKASGCVQ